MHTPMMYLVKLFLLISLAYIIGTERANHGKVIGFRSVSILMLGAFIYTTISLKLGGDVTRIVAQIITGVSFVGAGVIVQQGAKDVHNLTTAILVWVLPCIGILVGLGMIMEAISTTIIIELLLRYKGKNDNNGS